MEPYLHHLQFFLHYLSCPLLRILSWLLALLAWLDASNFGSIAYAHKFLTYMVGLEGEVPCQSSRSANMWLPGTFFSPPIRLLLKVSWRGQGNGTQLRGSSAGRLALIEWMKPKKDTGCGPEGHSNPPLPLLWSSAYPVPWRGPSILQFLGAQTSCLSFKGNGCDLWGFEIRWGRQDMGANHHCCGRFLWFHTGNHNTAHLVLWPAN